MLDTNLKHVESREEIDELLKKNGKVVEATSSIQNEKKITDILDEVFKD
ncbi:MAG: hypothetical protein ABIK53_02275 [bacterium]